MPVREKALPSVTRGAGAPSPSRQGPCLCSNRQRWAGRRKEIKPVLKEGHLAGEEKGIRNPLLWGAFKWGGNPHTGLHSPGPVRPHTSSHTASQPSPPSAVRPAQGWGTGSHPLVGWPPFHPLLRVPDLGLPVLPAAWRRHHTVPLQGMPSLTYMARAAGWARLCQSPAHTQPQKSSVPTARGWHLWNSGVPK